MIKYKNQLQLYRHRMRLSQQQVVKLLGNSISRYKLSRFENGVQMPPLATALALEIVYRVPIAFCYSDLYQDMRQQLRSAEAQIANSVSLKQGLLF
jgi:transcriptional regulator with XRE-family HTH domain